MKFKTLINKTPILFFFQQFEKATREACDKKFGNIYPSNRNEYIDIAEKVLAKLRKEKK